MSRPRRRLKRRQTCLLSTLALSKPHLLEEVVPLLHHQRSLIRVRGDFVIRLVDGCGKDKIVIEQLQTHCRVHCYFTLTDSRTISMTSTSASILSWYRKAARSLFIWRLLSSISEKKLKSGRNTCEMSRGTRTQGLPAITTVHTPQIASQHHR